MSRNTLRSYLTTGMLGGVRLGLTEADVRNLLGEPEREYESMAEPSKEWLYGAASFTFHKGTVISIGLNFGDQPDLPHNLQMDGYTPQPGTTLEEFLIYARSENLFCAEDIRFSSGEANGLEDNRKVLVVGDGITAWFFGDPLQLDQLLYSTGRTPPEYLQPLW